MSWKKRRDNSDAIEIVAFGKGLMVQGSPTAVSVFVDQMLETTSQAGGRSRRLLADGLAVAANVAALKQTHREYIEFSDRARKFMEKHGKLPATDGTFWSFVRDHKGFAGNLDWKQVNLGPEQALALQTAAAQMALRAAIKDVVAAIERVEGKVDELVKRSRAERLGSAAGDRLSLQRMVERVRSSGHISKTDWSTIASLGPMIARDTESLRAYILLQLKEVKESSFARSRADEAKDLTDQLLKESIALLVIAEQNFALWQELRVAHAQNHEAGVLQSTTIDVRHQLAELSEADQRLIDTLQEVVSRLLTPTGFEGFAPLQKRRLREYGGELREMSAWFADQRHLDVVSDIAVTYPGLSDSLGKLGDVIKSGVRLRTESIATESEHMLKRRATEARPALRQTKTEEPDTADN